MLWNLATIYEGTADTGAMHAALLVAGSALFCAGYGICWVIMTLRGKTPRKL